jgi:hypothetical protein
MTNNAKIEIEFDSTGCFEILTDELRAVVEGGGGSALLLSSSNTVCPPNVLCFDNLSCLDQACEPMNGICYDGEPKDVGCSGPEGQRNGVC